MRLRMIGASLVIAAALLAGSVGAVRAQSGLWAIDTNACSTDGARCIKGVLKNQPYPTKEACEKNLQALMREYHAAHLNVMFMRCVIIR